MSYNQQQLWISAIISNSYSIGYRILLHYSPSMMPSMKPASSLNDEAGFIDGIISMIYGTMCLDIILFRRSNNNLMMT